MDGKITKSIHEHKTKKIALLTIGLFLYFGQLSLCFFAYHTFYRSFPPLFFLLPLFFIYLFSKLYFCIDYRPYISERELNESIAILLPFFNEELDILKAQYDTIKKQTYQNIMIYYVDDGSSDPECYNYLKKLVKKDKQVKLFWKENAGKRHAQAFLLKYVTEDLIYTTDSDTILEPDCIEQLMQAFDDLEIVAVTGQVQALNGTKNILTRLLQIRYFNAFESERSAQSRTENVLVCSGPNSMYRNHILKDNVNEYINQMFLGQPQTYGDDRCLTNFAMRYGRVVYQSTAITHTEVPFTMDKFTRQQIRWGKSFVRESYFAIFNTIKYKRWITLLWVLTEIIMVPVFLATISIFFKCLMNDEKNIIDITFFFSFISVNSYIRNLYYLPFDLRVYLISPIYGFIHIFWVTPLKVYSFIMLRDVKWGTR